jgi:uncharacterized protein
MRLLIILCFYLVLAGCQSAPPVQFYVLEPIHTTITSTSPITPKTSVGIGPLTLPAILDRNKIVTRQLNQTLKIAEFHHWAAPLQEILSETLARNVGALNRVITVRKYPWTVYGQVDLQVIVDVVRFDTTPGQSANLKATWTIKNEKANRVIQNGKTNLNQPLTDRSYPGTVRGLSHILASFSQELNSALLKSLALENIPEQ